MDVRMSEKGVARFFPQDDGRRRRETWLGERRPRHDTMRIECRRCGSAMTRWNASRLAGSHEKAKMTRRFRPRRFEWLNRWNRLPLDNPQVKETAT